MDDQEIARAQDVGQIANAKIARSILRALVHEQARGIARLDRVLCDRFRRELVVEVGCFHRDRLGRARSIAGIIRTEGLARTIRMCANGKHGIARELSIDHVEDTRCSTLASSLHGILTPASSSRLSGRPQGEKVRESLFMLVGSLS